MKLGSDRPNCYEKTAASLYAKAQSNTVKKV